MEGIFVSIIIPTYNRSHFIGETLDSIVTQTYKNWECIVVDDGSKDYTAELMEFYCTKQPKIQFHRRPKNSQKGANACRNYGLELSKGNYVKWFDSDDLMHPSYLERIKIGLKDKLQPDLIINNALYFSDDKAHPDRIFNNLSTPENLLLDYLTGKIFINTQVTIWRKVVVQEYKFDETLSRAQELEFHFRILKNEDVKVQFINEVLISIRNHEASITGEYMKGGVGHLTSELTVRRKILQYLFEQNVPANRKKESFRFYLMALSRLCKSRPITNVFEELSKLEKNLGINKIPVRWKFNLLQLLIVYKTTGRDYRLENHLKSLTDIINDEPQERT